MNLDVDAVFDRRRLKRGIFIWRGLALAAFIVIVTLGAAMLSEDVGFGLGEQAYVARLDVSNIIVEDHKRLDRLHEIAEDDSARALILYINSPGGTVVGGESLHHALRAVAAAKPVVAVMGTTAASAGYMIAAGADRIYARAGTITGSIGVIMQTAQVTDLLAKLGIRAESIKSGPLKAVPSPLENLSEEGRKATQALVDEMQAMFMTMVRERRSLTPEQTRTIADGRVFTGARAIEAGLVDALGGEEAARDWLADEHQISRSVPTHPVMPDESASWIREMLSFMVGKTLFSERLTLDGLIAVWHPKLRF